MVLEHAILNVKMGSEADFERDFRQAQKIISQMPGYIEHSLQRHKDITHQYLLLVKWQRMEDHTEGFRQSDGYQQWRKLLHHYYEPFPSVEYYMPVSGCGMSGFGMSACEPGEKGDNAMVDDNAIRLVAATDESQWIEASELLVRCAQSLAARGVKLWRVDELAPAVLKNTYKLDELYFLCIDDAQVGLVFLQDQDHIFWPEALEDSACYIHKLAIDPDFVGRRLGLPSVLKIIDQAKREGKTWLRLDCDDRPALNRFYQGCGFSYVDTKKLPDLEVVRYQLRLN